MGMLLRNHNIGELTKLADVSLEPKVETKIVEEPKVEEKQVDKKQKKVIRPRKKA